ncbi:MAG TPA: hypothetical protein VEY91_00525 [Candidatus Limnocylindria bacterium]|nr:hypothetical protein [Candidatus Limnocylindria bacterium]
MTRRLDWVLVVFAIAGAILATAPVSASSSVARDLGPMAQASPPDTTLDDFLEDYADSTERYFGMAAAPLDTAGLDSALAFGLAHPDAAGDRSGRFALGFGPWLAFNRVDGPLYGATAKVGQPRLLGELQGRLGYAVGPNDWMGGGEYTKLWGFRGSDATWLFNASAGRFTGVMDRDRADRIWASLRAFVAGTDNQRYLRRDGFWARLEYETSWWRLGTGYRDELESPLEVTTTWNLRKKAPSVVDNLPAALGRAREAMWYGTVRLPLIHGGWATAEHRSSGSAINSDFDYRRTRAAVGAEVPIAGVVSLVPQFEYGRLGGELVPQAAFYLGGSRSLQTVESSSRGGTGEAFGRLDLIGAPELFRFTNVLGIPPNSVQAGLFGALGAIWGPDPYGGPTIPGVDWPEREGWLGEVGISILLRPGLPDPAGFIHFDWAWPIGPDARERGFSVYYARPLFLVRPIVR